jgi:hypothetical protein
MFKNPAGMIRVDFYGAQFASDAEGTSLQRDLFVGSHFLSPVKGPDETHLTPEPSGTRNVSLAKRCRQVDSSENPQLIPQPFSLLARAACKDKSWWWFFHSLSPTGIPVLSTET